MGLGTFRAERPPGGRPLARRRRASVRLGEVRGGHRVSRASARSMCPVPPAARRKGLSRSGACGPRTPLELPCSSDQPRSSITPVGSLTTNRATVRRIPRQIPRSGARARRRRPLPDYPRLVSPEREELRRLVEDLPDERVAPVLAEARRQSQPPKRQPEAWPPAWFGAITSERTDWGRNHDDLLAEGFGRS